MGINLFDDVNIFKNNLYININNTQYFFILSSVYALLYIFILSTLIHIYTPRVY